ncbi:MAG: TonB-dependent receptor [Acidobacteria bacterium]|nr:TonB-dependent receptor [Acidobacteriota bacterium]
MRNKSLLLLLFCLIYSFTYISVLAQSGSTTASVVGTVKDPQKALIAGATVTLTRIETNSVRTFETNQEGVFQQVQLPPGSYEMTVSAPGYKQIKTKFEISIGSTILSEVELPLDNATNEVIEVRADNIFSEVKTESSNNNDLSRISGLPINRRDFLDFALTSPRVVFDRVPNQGIFSTSGLSFNGQSGRFNNITIDGLDNNDVNQGAVRATFSQEAVQEFQVVSDGYSAEFGRALAGIVNIVTKTGGNDFHGSLFFLNRNDEISARNTFDKLRSPYSQYQFGATLSGPIKRDRAFFFSSFERLTIKQNNIVTISDDTVRAGRNLNYFLGNGNQPFSVGTTSFLGRVDVRVNENDTFWVRYNNSYTYDGGFEPFGDLRDRTSGGILNVDDNTVAFNNTYVSAALNLVNETRFLYSRRNQGTLPVSDDAGVQLLTPEGNVSFGHNNFVPEFNSQRVYQILNNVSLTRGRHQIKFGADFTSIRRLPQSEPALFPDGFGVFTNLDFSVLLGMPGLPSLTGLQSFDPSLRTPEQQAFLTFLSSAIPGLPSGLNLAQQSIPITFLQGFGDRAIEVTPKLFSTFVQDDIRVKQNLIVKLGLRYDITRVNFTPSNNGNFSPRISIAYKPTKLPRVNVRASYGLFFALPFTRATVSSRSSQIGSSLLFVPFPFSALPFSLPKHKFASIDQVPPNLSFIPQLSLSTQYQKDLKSSYSQQITLGVDYLVANNTVVALSYNFVRGIRLFSLRDINPVVNPVPGDPLTSMIVGRIDKTRGSVLQFESAFDSYYHAFSIGINRSFTKKLNFLAHYTFSKGIDNVADFNSVVTDRANDPLTPGNERGLSLQDIRNRFVLSSIWKLDYTQNPYLKDFELSTIISLNTGRPYNLLASVDLNQNGDGGLSDRPTALGRNVGLTPGFATIDMRLTRKITFNEKYQIQAFIEGFNMFNRVNINPNSIDRTFPPNAQGGFNLPPQEDGRFIVTPDRFRGAFAPRQFQFGFRFAF